MKRASLAVIATFAAAPAPGAAFASDRSDVIAALQAFNDAGNKADRSAYAAFCTSDAVVVDHVPPYVFQGPTACADEYDAVVAWGADNKIGTDDLFQKIYAPVSFEIDGQSAYAVFPAKAWFKQDGRAQVENLYLTAVLRRETTRWRIARLVYSTLGWKGLAQAPGR